MGGWFKAVCPSLALQLLLTPVAVFGDTAFKLNFTSQPVGASIGAGLGKVVVQIADKRGRAVAQSGTVIVVALNKSGGLAGVNQLTTDATGKATLTNLQVNTPGTNYALVAGASGLKSAISSSFNVARGGASVGLTSSTNNLIYGQSATFTATVKPVAPATNALTGTITFQDGGVVLGSALINSAGVATFKTNRMSAVPAAHMITAVYSGSPSYSGATSGSFLQAVNPLGLTVSGIVASNKVYDGTTVAALKLTSAKLVTPLAGDSVTLNTTGATGIFASKNVGNGKAVTISGLTLAGMKAANYSLSQPVATANITIRSLIATAVGQDKVYDGTKQATVLLSDNRVSGDSFADGYAAAVFTNKNAGTNLLVKVAGLVIAGTDAANYALTSTNTATHADITPAFLTVSAVNLSRLYGMTNPLLVAVYSGFVPGESKTNSDLAGSPSLSTAAKTNSHAGSYPITVAQGTLSSKNYSLTLSNGLLTVAPVGTALQLTTSLTPALTNQSVTFTARVTPSVTNFFAPAGTVQFVCNGTNLLGNAVNLANGQAALTSLAGLLGKNNVNVTAVYSDPSGNFGCSSNSVTETVVSPAPPPPCKLSLKPALPGGKVTANLSGTAWTTYVIQASADLVHWTAISTNVADVNGIVSLVDLNAAAFPCRYYRAYSP